MITIELKEPSGQSNLTFKNEEVEAQIDWNYQRESPLIATIDVVGHW